MIAVILGLARTQSAPLVVRLANVYSNKLCVPVPLALIQGPSPGALNFISETFPSPFSSTPQIILAVAAASFSSTADLTLQISPAPTTTAVSFGATVLNSGGANKYFQIAYCALITSSIPTLSLQTPSLTPASPSATFTPSGATINYIAYAIVSGFSLTAVQSNSASLFGYCFALTASASANGFQVQADFTNCGKLTSIKASAIYFNAESLNNGFVYVAAMQFQLDSGLTISNANYLSQTLPASASLGAVVFGVSALTLSTGDFGFTSFFVSSRSTAYLTTRTSAQFSKAKVTFLSFGRISCLGGVCVCPAGLYYDKGSATCKPCSAQCHTCSGPLTCDCSKALKYYDYQFNSCSLCVTGCLTCSNSFSCTECNNNTIAYYTASTNVCSCRIGYYMANNQCQNCDSSVCYSCIDSPANCICSRTGFYLSTALQCMSCPPLCAQCTATSCASCVTGSSFNSLNACVCPDNYFYQPSNNNCQLCSSNCWKCGSASCLCLKLRNYIDSNGVCQACTIAGCNFCTDASTCTGCTSNAVLSNNVCNCNLGLFLSSGQCLACRPVCLTCSVSASNCGCVALRNYLLNSVCTQCPQACTSCNQNGCYACVENANLNSGSCNCNRNSFLASKFSCVPCDPSCLTCNAQGCICNSLRKYLDNSNACTSCISACLYCTSGVNCLICTSRAVFRAGACECPVGFYMASGQCVACDETCLACDGQGFCCAVLRHFFSGTCQSCLPNCVLCTNSLSCTICIPNSYFATNQCLCLDGFVQIGASCEACDSTCRTCAGSTTSCTCPLVRRYYLPPNCLTCSDLCYICASAAQCTQCVPFAIINQYSACQCVSRYFPSSVSACSSCISSYSATCLICTASQCTCDSLSGVYLDSQRNCASCSTGCLLCSTANSCSSCISAATSVQGRCLCPRFFYMTGTGINSYACVPCPNNCLLCSATSCSCYALNPSFGTGNFLRNGVCSTCSMGCVSCTSLGDCTSCIGGTWSTRLQRCTCEAKKRLSFSGCNSCASDCLICLDNGECSCSSVGFYLSNGVCANCLVGCNMCLTGSACLQCKSTAVLTSQNICQCPLSNFMAANGICNACAAGCLICTSSVCTCSSRGNFAANVQTCASCPVGCLTCTSSNNCQQCFSIKASFNGVRCICAPGYFSSNPRTCTFCGTTCLHCTSLSNCLCPSRQHYLAPDLTCNNCLPGCLSCTQASQCDICTPFSTFVTDSCVCNNGYYRTASFSCRLCPSTCLTCTLSGNLPTCTCLKRNNYLDIAGVCSPCAQGCVICVAANSCLTCVALSFFVSNYCKCQVGLFFNPTDYYCQQCPSSCRACTSALPANCQCSVLGQNLDSNQVCFNCPTNCKVCLSAVTCGQCYDFNMYFEGSQCTCEVGYYLQAKACILCPSDCWICSSPSLCSCSKVGNFLDGRTCSACPRSCLSCSRANSCNVCGTGSEFSPSLGACICKLGLFASDNSCQSCPATCLDCVSAQSCICPAIGNFVDLLRRCLPCPTNCLFCINALRCDKCPDGSVYNRLNRACQALPGFYVAQFQVRPCDTVCWTCLTQSKKCVCPKLSYYFENGQCARCADGCLSCTSGLSCQICFAGSEFIKTKCICSIGKYLQSKSNSCQNCLSTCYTCADASSCTCQIQGNLYENGTCWSCPTGCTACSGLTNCTSCEENRILKDNFCIPKPTGSFFNEKKGMYVCPRMYSAVNGQCVFSNPDASPQQIKAQISALNTTAETSSTTSQVIGGSIMFGFIDMVGDLLASSTHVKIHLFFNKQVTPILRIALTFVESLQSNGVLSQLNNNYSNYLQPMMPSEPVDNNLYSQVYFGSGRSFIVNIFSVISTVLIMTVKHLLIGMIGKAYDKLRRANVDRGRLDILRGELLMFLVSLRPEIAIIIAAQFFVFSFDPLGMTNIFLATLGFGVGVLVTFHWVGRERIYMQNQRKRMTPSLLAGCVLLQLRNLLCPFFIVQLLDPSTQLLPSFFLNLVCLFVVLHLRRDIKTFITITCTGDLIVSLVLQTYLMTFELNDFSVSQKQGWSIFVITLYIAQSACYIIITVVKLLGSIGEVYSLVTDLFRPEQGAIEQYISKN